jgi:hypothetical protein
VYYDATAEDSYITLLVAPNPDADVVFNNIEFKAELYEEVNGEWVDVNSYDNGITQQLPIKSIRVWNEYQDSGDVSLVYNTNISRKFRDWNLWIPRDSVNIMDRIRGQWVYIKLTIDNSLNRKLILHDIILSYGE